MPEQLLRPLVIADRAAHEQPSSVPLGTSAGKRTGARLEPLVREWLLVLQALGRSPKTIDWYRKHIHGYFQELPPRTLDKLTAAGLKQYLAAIQASIVETFRHHRQRRSGCCAEGCLRLGYLVFYSALPPP